MALDSINELRAIQGIFAAPDDIAAASFPSLATTRTELARRLNDSNHVIWSADKLNGFLQEGYDEFCSRTLCLWRRMIFPGVVAGTAVYDSPDDLIRLERATWDDRSLLVLESFDLRRHDERYLDQGSGTVDIISSDGDGIKKFRLYRAPESVEADPSSDEFGVPRQMDFEAGSDSAYGIPRRINFDESSQAYGSPRVLGVSNLILEFSRKGQPLTDASFEIPDRFVRYVKDYAMWRCLRIVGPGQDLDLAEHYRQRFEAGVRVTKNRVKDAQVSGSRVARRVGPPPLVKFGPDFTKREIF